MNKHGQTLILFIILIPIIIFLIAFIVDYGLVLNEKLHVIEVTKEAIKENINYNKDIKNILTDNSIDVDNLNITNNDSKVTINNDIYVKSIFGNIIGKKEYKVQIKVIGYKENDKIVFE